jgi:heme oxygenase
MSHHLHDLNHQLPTHDTDAHAAAEASDPDLADLDVDEIVHADPPPDVLAELRAATRDQIARMERHPLRHRLLRGALPYHSYVIYLSQLYILHRALDTHLRRQRSISPRVAAIVRHYHLQEAYLLCDLAFFDVDADRLHALPATQAMIVRFAQAAAEAPIELLGFHYVLEDGKNAARPLAEAASRSYSLVGGHGTTYLDSYGPQQAKRWHTFECDMTAAGFSAVETTMMVGAAEEMLEGVIAVMDDVARVTG